MNRTRDNAIFFAEWYWKCFLFSYYKKMLAIMAGILSVAVVWSEVTFFNKSPPLSIFAIIVDVSKKNYDYLAIEVIYVIQIIFPCEN